MIVSNQAVKNRISVLVMALIIFVIGLASYISLPRESAPDITIPNVFVQTNYKGVSAEDIETGITIKIEKKLKGLKGVKNIKSVSSEGLSQINVEFLPGTDIDEVLSKVRDKVDEASSDLPSDLENNPSVFEVNISEMPIIIFSLSGTSGSRNLRNIADNLKDTIEAIPGVLEAEVTGGREREIRIEVDADKLAYYRIPIHTLQQKVSGENQNTSGGAITLGDGRYQLRVPGEFETPEDIMMLVVATHQGQPIYLKDVASVSDGLKDEHSRSRLNGVESINIAVKKRVGENIIEIADHIDESIARLQPTWPAGTKITKLMNESKEIRTMVADLENNIVSGLLLVIVVLLFAMGMRNAILVSAAIPFSMLLSFGILHALGITLNMVVLFSLTLALGMLVDNAIVIVENIYRYMEQGIGRIPAAIQATSEVAWPVIGSTLTTLAAFFPMLFWPGIMGEFMKYLPITLIVTLSSSLFVALVINPALCAFFMKNKKIVSQNELPVSNEKTEKIVQEEAPIEIRGPILRAYSAILHAALRHKIIVLGVSFATLVILIEAWVLRVGLKNPVEFFPRIDPKSINVNIDPPEGADLAYVDNIARQVEMAISGQFDPEKPLPLSQYPQSYSPVKHRMVDGGTFLGPTNIDNIEYVYANVTNNAGGGGIFGLSPNRLGIQFLDFESRLSPTPNDLETIRKRLRYIAGAEIVVAEQNEGPPTGAPINIEISGDSFSLLGELATKLRAFLAKIPHVEDIQDDFVAGLPSVRVRIDKQKAALFGLTTNAIGSALKTAYNGMEVSTYYEGDEDHSIVVSLGEADRHSTDVLHKLMIPTPQGTLIPLTSLANIDFTGSIGNIVRINNNRVVTVKASVSKEISGTVVREQAEKLLADFELPPGYQMKFTGENEHQQESQDFLGKAFVVALMLIFLILVAMFNSVTQPLIILTSVILSLGGAFLGLFLFRSPFGIIMSGVGVISLAGVVVNNSIVLIDYTNKLRERGMELVDAVVAAGATRLRPVFLTAITTVLGLLPMITGVSFDFHKMSIAWSSESTMWWRSMAIVVAFGLIVATVLTLVVTPTLYALLENSKQRLSQRIRARSDKQSERLSA